MIKAQDQFEAAGGIDADKRIANVLTGACKLVHPTVSEAGWLNALDRHLGWRGRERAELVSWCWRCHITPERVSQA